MLATARVGEPRGHQRLAARLASAVGVVVVGALLSAAPAPTASIAAAPGDARQVLAQTIAIRSAGGTSASGTTDTESTDGTPALTLTPEKESGGSRARASVTGFGRCQAFESDGSGSVEFFWDGEDSLGTVPVSDSGTAGVDFLVPRSASLGKHTVLASCVTADDVSAKATFVVDEPEMLVTVPKVIGLSREEAEAALTERNLVVGRATGGGPKVTAQDPVAGREVKPRSPVNLTLTIAVEPLVEVPDVVGLSVEDAQARLAAAGLRPGTVSGTGRVVAQQSPRPAVEVPRRTVVDLTVVPVRQRTVVVPDLVGRRRANVPGLLTDRGLVLGATDGNGDVVRSQNPVAGTRVRSGSAVSVSFEAVVRPPPLVRVPDVVGDTTTSARDELAGAGLELGNEPRGGSVTGQDPPAGTLVPRGTSVTLASNPAAPSGSGWRWAGAAVLAALAASGGAVTRSVRRRQDQRWVRAHLRAVPRMERPAHLDVDPAPEGRPAPTHAVRVTARSGESTCVLEEVGR